MKQAMNQKQINKFRLAVAILGALSLTGCGSASKYLNPFYEPPKPVALLGEANDKALNGGADSEDKARQALEQMASYQRARDPQPVNPVMQPAVVRLMWIPDHLNRNGDLVPAHYYYLKVLKDRWAVQDAFEVENQLNGSDRASDATSNVPYVLDSDSKK
jgi:hypothetical protein